MTPEFLNSTLAVSYTHLDVYKRQGVMYAGPIADAAAAVVAIFYALRELNIMKNLEKKAV